MIWFVWLDFYERVLRAPCTYHPTFCMMVDMGTLFSRISGPMARRYGKVHGGGVHATPSYLLSSSSPFLCGCVTDGQGAQHDWRPPQMLKPGNLEMALGLVRPFTVLKKYIRIGARHKSTNHLSHRCCQIAAPRTPTTWMLSPKWSLTLDGRGWEALRKTYKVQYCKSFEDGTIKAKH